MDVQTAAGGGLDLLRARGLGRVVWAHVVPWQTPTEVTPRDGGPAFTEWFARGSLWLPPGPAPGFWLRHRRDGGTRVGRVVQLEHGPTWCDAAAIVDDGPVGDAFLDSLGDARVPVSIGFTPWPNSSVRYEGTEYGPGGVGVERVRAWLEELAVVEQGAYEGAYVYARSDIGRLALATGSK